MQSARTLNEPCISTLRATVPSSVQSPVLIHILGRSVSEYYLLASDYYYLTLGSLTQFAARKVIHLGTTLTLP